MWARRGPAKRPGAKTGLRGEKLKSGRKDKTIGWRDSKTWEVGGANKIFQFKTWDKHSVREELTEWRQGLGTGFRGRKEGIWRPNNFEMTTYIHIEAFGFLVKAGCCSRACPPLIVTVVRCSGKKVTTGASNPFPLTHPIPPPTLPSDSCMSTPSSVSSHKLNASKKVSWSTVRL